jgi:hypothetical protein
MATDFSQVDNPRNKAENTSNPVFEAPLHHIYNYLLVIRVDLL